MVTVEPDLGQVFKFFVFGNFFYRQMAVKIEDGHIFGEIAEEYFGCFSMQQKIFGQKWLHFTSLILSPGLASRCAGQCN
jgi:hypothetical protein